MITIDDIARMRVAYAQTEGREPTNICLTHHDYDCLVDEYAFIVYREGSSKPPRSYEYKGDMKLFGMVVSIGEKTELGSPQKFTRNEIGNMFGVPGHLLLGDGRVRR